MPGEVPLPSHENLHQDLLNLVGREFDYSDTTFLTREEAEALLRHIDAWLPSKLGPDTQLARSYDIDPPYGQETVDDDYRTIQQTFSWGDIDWNTVHDAGVAVEFAGPTIRSEKHHILPDALMDVVTNVTAQPLGLDSSKLGAVADVRNMPIADESVGSVHISALNGAPREFEQNHESDLRDKALQEAARVIRPGGYLVWDGGTQQDYDLIIKLGFEPVKIRVQTRVYEVIKSESPRRYLGHELDVDGVFRKAI